MMLDPEVRVRRHDDGSIDYTFYRAEAKRLHVEEKKRLFGLARLRIRTVARALRERGRELRFLPRAGTIEAK